MSKFTYKPRTKAVNERTLTAKKLLAKTPEGQFGAVVPPSQAAVRAAVKAQLCSLVDALGCLPDDLLDGEVAA